MESTLARASSIRAFIRRSALSSSSWVAGRPVTPSKSFRSGRRLCSSTPSCLHQPETHQHHSRQIQPVCEAAAGALQAVLRVSPVWLMPAAFVLILTAHPTQRWRSAAPLVQTEGPQPTHLATCAEGSARSPFSTLGCVPVMMEAPRSTGAVKPSPWWV